jgi:bacterioferritin-associated ferredoxin
MYVCVCNAIKSSEIEALARAGVEDAAQVYEALDVETNCASCVDYVQEALDEFRGEHLKASDNRDNASA